MTSRERVIRTFYHEKTDRVPIDYMANPAIDRKLKHHFRLKDNDDEGLRRALHVDFREIAVPYTGPVLHDPIPGLMVDPAWGFRRKWVTHDWGGYWDYAEFPLKDLDMEMAENWPTPSPDDYDYSVVEDRCKQWKDPAIYIGNPGLGDIMNTTGFWCGTETVYLSVGLKDPAWLCLVDRRLDFQLEQTKRILEAAKGRIDFMWLGEDLGTQTGPLISPQSYRELIKPRHKKFVDLAKAYNIPVMFHSCGSSSWAFEDMIEMGISAIDTLQPEVANMEPSYLKRNYGDRLAFHGVVSTAGPLATAPVDEFKRSLREILSIMMEGGGYFLAPTHEIQDNTPLENALALYEFALKWGKYESI
ncbi:methylcobalamin:coenzyme M methyltransferase [bacterium BMS3Abin05]|nr:methylcobalamin:coenzyme M methyltransferase [bacterium BMS3Abin05]GBE28259.1 methylcobalamin:coenzyme M methyltransferase [bacterium BMS3Bbin03]HDZ11293.1 hypothetical protein [Bacteroidota bacterium]